MECLRSSAGSPSSEYLHVPAASSLLVLLRARGIASEGESEIVKELSQIARGVVVETSAIDVEVLHMGLD